MKANDLQALYHSLDPFEITILQQSLKDFEQQEKIRFTSLYAYITHLATAVIDRQQKGEFVPRSIEESRAERYL